MKSGREDDSEPEQRWLQQAEDSKQGIVGSQFSIFTSSILSGLRTTGLGAAASQLIAPLHLILLLHGRPFSFGCRSLYWTGFTGILLPVSLQLPTLKHSRWTGN